MTQAGYSGNPRYLIGPAGVACVVAGVGWAELGRSVLARAGIAPRLVAPLALALVVALSLPWTYARANALRAPAPGRTPRGGASAQPAHGHRPRRRPRPGAGLRPPGHAHLCGAAARVDAARARRPRGLRRGRRRGRAGASRPRRTVAAVAGAGYREVARTRLWRIVTPCAASSETASATTATPAVNTRNVGSSPSAGTASPAATAGTEIDR